MGRVGSRGSETAMAFDDETEAACPSIGRSFGWRKHLDQFVVAMQRRLFPDQDKACLLSMLCLVHKVGDVGQRNGGRRAFVGRLLKVIESGFVKDTPATFFLERQDLSVVNDFEPSTTHRIGKGDILLHLDLIFEDVLIELFKELARKVFGVVDAAILCDKLRDCHFALDGGIVDVGVEHDGRKGEDVKTICRFKHFALALLKVLSGKCFHQAVDLLSFSGQTERVKEAPEGNVKVDTLEIKEFEHCIAHLGIEFSAVAEKVSEFFFVNEVALEEEPGQRFGRMIIDEFRLDQELDSLLGILVEEGDAFEGLSGRFDVEARRRDRQHWRRSGRARNGGGRRGSWEPKVRVGDKVGRRGTGGERRQC